MFMTLEHIFAIIVGGGCKFVTLLFHSLIIFISFNSRIHGNDDRRVNDVSLR